ncbi:MAG: hypothetical protein Q9202_006235 [Teloschistes flavicans]
MAGQRSEIPGDTDCEAYNMTSDESEQQTADELHLETDTANESNDEPQETAPDGETSEDGRNDEASDGEEDFSDEEFGYESPKPTTECECGYTSYGSEFEGCDDASQYDPDDYLDAETVYDVSDDVWRVWHNKVDGPLLREGNLSKSYRHHVICMEKESSFPFEKLPPEIRSMILRLMMPDDRTLSLHSREYDWGDGCGGYYMEADILGPSMEEEDPRPARIPRALFRVSKSISAEASRIFRTETYFRFDLTAFGIHCRDGKTEPLDAFTHHAIVAEWKAFKYMQKYHLNIKSSSARKPRDHLAVKKHRDPHDYESGAEEIKEYLRLVCDELAKHTGIRDLIVTAPCICAHWAADMIPKDESTMINLFAPLKRISLATPVQFSLHNDRRLKQGTKSPCRKPACVSLAHRIRVSIGKLEGAALSEHEATWKEVKTLYHQNIENRKRGGRKEGYKYECSSLEDIGISDVWTCLNEPNPWPNRGENFTFENSVKFFHARQAREEKKRLQRKREYEDEDEVKRAEEKEQREQQPLEETEPGAVN